MKLVLTDFYNQPTMRLLSSLDAADIPYQHVNVIYDGFLPQDMLNPFADAMGTIGAADRLLHYNEIAVPDFYEIRNQDGARAEILQGDNVRGYIYYEASTARLVREVQWLSRQGKLQLAQRYNRQGFHFADAIFGAEGKEVKTIYYDQAGRKVLTMDAATRAVIDMRGDVPVVYAQLTDFVSAYIRRLMAESATGFDELIFNSLSTPFFASNQLTELPASLYFQEPIGDAIPGNMATILTGETPTTRVIFENDKLRAKAEKLAGATELPLMYLGAIEHFSRDNRLRPQALSITRSDQILYDEAVARALAEGGIHWTIAAPSEVSDKLRHFANAHENVTVLETIQPDKVAQLLAEHDLYLDLNRGGDYQDVVHRAYLEGLLVVGDGAVAKSPGYELILTKEAEILDLIRRPDKAIALRVLREKRGKPAVAADYQELFG